MVEGCVEDIGGGGYHLGDAIITGQAEILPGLFINDGDYSSIGGGGKRRKKSRKLRKSNKTRMISRSKKSRSRSNKKVYRKKSLSKKSFKKKSRKSRKLLR